MSIEKSAGAIIFRKEPFGSAQDRKVPFGSAQDRKVPFGSAQDRKVPFGSAQDRKVPFHSAQDRKVPFHSAQDRKVPFHSAQDRKVPFHSAQDRGEKLLFLLLHYPSRAEQELGDGSKLRRRQTSSTSGLRSQKDYWDLSKGHIEKGENPEDAAKREVEEETGLKNIEFVNGFKETIKYFFKWQGENVLKFVTFYLAETPYRDKSGTGQAETVKISQEHIGYVWLPYKEALLKLTFKNAKEVLQKANDFLQ